MLSMSFNNAKNIFTFFTFIATHSQGSNNSDQSSGYLSGSGGSSSLPVNANVIDAQRHYDYNYGQTRFETLNNNNNQGNSNNLKKYSMTSSMNEYPSPRSNEREIEFNNGEK